MFKKYYKDANNDINTNRQLIDNIFESAKINSPKRKKIALYKYGAAIAAVFVVVLTVAFYDDIVRLNNENIVNVSESKENAEHQKADTQNQKNVFIKPQQGNEQQVKKQSNEESISQMTRLAPESSEEDVSQFSRNIEGEAVNKFAVKIDDFTEVSETKIEEITEVLIQRFGEKDEETGNIFIFEIMGRVETERGGYYLGRWKWFVVDHSSLLTTFVLNEDMTELYECILNAETDVVLWSEENNLFE